MNTCPCCSGKLLRHVEGGHLYWFCRHCWQEMPDYSDLFTVVSNRQNTMQRCLENSLRTVELNIGLAAA